MTAGVTEWPAPRMLTTMSSVPEQTQPGSGETAARVRGLDTSIAHPARIYDYLLGGKDNFAADREAAERLLAVAPFAREQSRANRLFLGTAVHYLVRAGVRQFLDIGTGLPAANNTHEVAQRDAPDARIVYVDNDPMVLLHAQTLLTSTREGRCDYLDADLRNPDAILSGAARTLDFGQPVAVMIVAVLNFIADDDLPYAITRRLMDAVPSGSYLAISHLASDIQSETVATGARAYNASSATAVTARPRAAVARFFDGLELVPPGVVPLGQWTPGDVAGHLDRPSGEKALTVWVGLARKP
jgi:hypothetical protein